jgi:nicotinate dehydrogenase subunit B
MISNTLPLSLIDNPILSQWIAFEENGRVRVGSGKVEIGQGILTALTQIAAEELDVRPDQINLVSGQTDVSPAEGFTSGSYSIAVGGASIRLVCAEVRSLFLERLAETLRCPAGELSIENGKFLRSGKDTGRDYWSMAGEIKLERRASGTAPVKAPSSYRIVGKHLPRLDLPAKIRGSGFIHDIVVENMLHARVLRQPWRGAHLAALDENAVRKAAKHPVEILREGEFVALTSDSEIAVMRSSEAARTLARWEGGSPPPSNVGTREWLKAEKSRDKVTDIGHRGPAPIGRTVEAEYSRPFLTYGSIGPCCALAEWKDNALKVWSHSQGPAVLRDWLARALGCPPRRSPCCIARARAPTATTPPTMRRSTPPISPCAIRAAPCGCSGRARTSSAPRRSAPRWRSSSARCSTRTTGPPTGRSKSGARRTRSGPV